MTKPAPPVINCPHCGQPISVTGPFLFIQFKCGHCAGRYVLRQAAGGLIGEGRAKDEKQWR
jgi:hypothetical protein